MYQVLEMFEMKYILALVIEKTVLYGSDMLMEFVLMIVSLYIYVKNIRNGVIYKKNIFTVIYEIIKDLISTLTLQQMGTANNYITTVLLGLFTLLLMFNLYGLLPLSYSITSQLSITVFLSFSMCLGVTIIGFLNMSYEYLYLFITREGDMPMLIVPFLIVIEFLSYTARYFSLGLRLFANMMAGHSLMVILSKFFLGFFDKFINIYDVIIIGLLVLMLGIVVLEIGVSFLQAYVFVLLITIYLSEAINN